VADGVAVLNLKASEQSREAAEQELDRWGKKFNAAKTPEERRTLIMSGQPFDGVSANFSAFPRGTSALELQRGKGMNTGGGVRAFLLKDSQASISIDDDGESSVQPSDRPRSTFPAPGASNNAHPHH
jgi:hypothetical protein